jgi:hypothetical protein
MSAAVRPAASQMRAQQVVSFTLVNADLDIEIGPLTNGTVIDCALLNTITLNVRANTSPNIVGSVRFNYDGNPNYNIENIAPYFLESNNGPDWSGWTPVDGFHTITATPYTGKSATGTVGTPLTVTFRAVSCTTDPTATPTPTGTLPTLTPSDTPPPGSTATPENTITPTATPFLTGTSEVTPIPLTPTATSTSDATATSAALTATPTSIFSVELLTNGGFEEATGNIPNNWTQKTPSKDKRKCNKDTNADGVDDKIIAAQGRCVYQFKSSLDENSRLRQQMGVSSDPTVARAGTGDALTLNGLVNASGSVDVRLKVRVKYKGGNLPKGKITLRLNSPTNGFVTFMGERQLPLAGQPDIIKVTIQNRGTSGKVRVDGMSLVLDRLIPDVVPLP